MRYTHAAPLNAKVVRVVDGIACSHSGHYDMCRVVLVLSDGSSSLNTNYRNTPRAAPAEGFAISL